MATHVARSLIALLGIVCGNEATAQAVPATCVSRASPTIFYVAGDGNDSATGTSEAAALRTIQAGVNCLTVPGDRLLLSPGTYTEFVSVTGKNGTDEMPMILEGYETGPNAGGVIIQGSLTSSAGVNRFNAAPPGAAPEASEWIPLGGGEYESREPLPPQSSDWDVNQGGFVDPVYGRHTRLLTYHRREDLTSQNETFEKIIDGCGSIDARPGPVLTTTANGCTERRPWVYMGPGIWFDKITNKIHIRLSHTHNRVQGLPDYRGATDPNSVSLAIANKSSPTLKVEGSTNILIKNVSIGHGAVSLQVSDSRNITVANVTVAAGRYGARVGRSSSITFENCSFDGGSPPWLFRGDLKDQYQFPLDGVTTDNLLAKQTSETLLGMEATSSVTVRHCEFQNAHDLYLQAADVEFHHNWIRNIHDEALMLDGSAEAGGAVHHNVVESTLSAISFAGDYIARPWYIFRNIVDLREPTAGFRPRNDLSDRAHVWRPGSPFKAGGKPEGSYHLFQNTFVVPFAPEYPGELAVLPQASFAHLRTPSAPGTSRRSLNNIFAVVDRSGGLEAPMSFQLPPEPCAGCDPTVATIEVNGDLFHTTGPSRALFATPKLGDPSHFDIFRCQASSSCEEAWLGTAFFERSVLHQPPGFQSSGSFYRDPGFHRWDVSPTVEDDFQLEIDSAARAAGVTLPADLRLLDGDAAAIAGSPDVGVYQHNQGERETVGLHVGVRGLRRYPQVPVTKEHCIGSAEELREFLSSDEASPDASQGNYRLKFTAGAFNLDSVALVTSGRSISLEGGYDPGCARSAPGALGTVIHGSTSAVLAMKAANGVSIKDISFIGYKSATVVVEADGGTIEIDRSAFVMDTLERGGLTLLALRGALRVGNAVVEGASAGCLIDGTSTEADLEFVTVVNAGSGKATCIHGLGGRSLITNSILTSAGADIVNYGDAPLIARYTMASTILGTIDLDPSNSFAGPPVLEGGGAPVIRNRIADTPLQVARDAGALVAGVPFDVLGNPRVIGPKPDLGAFELRGEAVFGNGFEDY